MGKTLLVAGYWYPYNNAGTMRWLNFSRYMDFDVLTPSVPTNSMLDYSLPNTNKKTIRMFKMLPAVLWGVLASIRVLFMKYDKYIITCPPESLLIGAFLLQLMGRNVVVDMRDSIDRDKQPFKFMVPFYVFLYKKIKNVVVAWQSIDETKKCVYHGYDIESSCDFVGYYSDRVSYGEYLNRLKKGFIPDQSKKPKLYYCSSFHSFKKLGYPVNNVFHPELETIEPKSHRERAQEMKSVLDHFYERNSK